ncbi:MAG: hypothetical protein ACOYXT_26465 [Bacteroidota bacterium]
MDNLDKFVDAGVSFFGCQHRLVYLGNKNIGIDKLPTSIFGVAPANRASWPVEPVNGFLY